MLSPSADMNKARPVVMNGWPRDPARLMTVLGSLVSSQNLTELAAAAAGVPESFFRAEQVVVLLEGSEGLVLGAQPRAGGALEERARDLLREGGPAAPSSTGAEFAVDIDAPEAGVRGVMALTLAAGSVGEGDLHDHLSELARLVATCAAQIVSRARSAQALKDAQTSLAKGLHDLRTPLNSMRLGMHLLEPGLAGQDPAIVQRTHRAVDRMAALVTEMSDALHKN